MTALLADAYPRGVAASALSHTQGSIFTHCDEYHSVMQRNSVILRTNNDGDGAGTEGTIMQRGKWLALAVTAAALTCALVAIPMVAAAVGGMMAGGSGGGMMGGGPRGGCMATTTTVPVAPGSGVCVSLGASVTAAFGSVDCSGAVSGEPAASGFPTASAGFIMAPGSGFHLTSTAEWSQGCTVTVTYDPATIGCDETELRMYHWTGAAWEDCTVRVDTVNNCITGLTQSFSPFCLGAPRVSYNEIAGSSRVEMALSSARASFDPSGTALWPGVKRVILASGDDSATTEALIAASLVRPLGAPLMLVRADAVPADVIAAIEEICDANPGLAVTITMVGTPSSLPDARYEQIAAAVGPARVQKHRVSSATTATGLAVDVARLARVTSWRYKRDCVVVVNADTSAGLAQATGAASIAAANGYPILLVGADSVPLATKLALWEFNAPNIICIGGPTVISDTVVANVRGVRWGGPDAASTAACVASNAIGRGWLSGSRVALSVDASSALSCGPNFARNGGVMLMSSPTSLSVPTESWLATNTARVADCYYVGGQARYSSQMRNRVGTVLAR